MWKIWLGIGIGGVVGFITILMGVINQARFTVILYRAVIAMICLGGCAYAIAFVYEKFLLPYLLHKKVSSFGEEQTEQHNGNRDEFVGEDRTEKVTKIDEEIEQAEFSPFTTENLNHVSPPNS